MMTKDGREAARLIADLNSPSPCERALATALDSLDEMEKESAFDSRVIQSKQAVIDSLIVERDRLRADLDAAQKRLGEIEGGARNGKERG